MNRESPKDPRIRKPCTARISIKSQAKQVGEEVVDLTGSGLMVTLGPKEAQPASWKTLSVGRSILALIVLFAMALVGYGLGQGRTETEYLPILEQLTEQVRGQKTTIDEKNEQIANQSTVLETNQGQLERYAKQVAQLEERLRPLDENGVRRDRMFEFYGEHPADLEPEFYLDEEFLAYCQAEFPEAVLPTNEWTVEAVLDSWQSSPEIWGFYDGVDGCGNTFFTWTPDYQHCFILDSDEPFLWDAEQEHEELISGWLVVDGIRVAMFDQETYDIEDPLELVRQYQAGEWDGSIRRSHDGSTTVEVSPYSGKLDYNYAAYWYDERFDPDGMAWQHFATEPWWCRKDLPEDLAQIVARSNVQGARPLAIENEPSHRWIILDVYVDVPVEHQLGKVVNRCVADGDIFLAESSQVYFFSKGELLDQWDFAGQSVYLGASQSVLLLGCKNPPAAYAQDLAYVYDHDRLFALRKGGEVALVLENITMADGLWSCGNAYFGLVEGKLMCYYLSSYGRTDDAPMVLAEGVLAVDFSELALFAKADGCYMLTRDDDYKMIAEYLGPESMQYYANFYKQMQPAWGIAHR